MSQLLSATSDLPFLCACDCGGSSVQLTLSDKWLVRVVGMQPMFLDSVSKDFSLETW